MSPLALGLPTVCYHSDRPPGGSYAAQQLIDRLPFRVISRHMQCKTACPLYPRKRTFVDDWYVNRTRFTQPMKNVGGGGRMLKYSGPKNTERALIGLLLTSKKFPRFFELR